MSNEVLIEVENVSKKFCRDLKKSLWYGVKDISSELTGRRSPHDQLRDGEFWAVDDVSFHVRRGECLGLIGHNGAGKTTILRMLNGLIKPDKGRITMRGNVSALIALGAGLNPILTGRENVYAVGAILGLTTQEIKEKYNAIVEFSELFEFMESPVQNYSSGMRVRLGFSVAVQMTPDILILDEVLAVGDASFRMKAYQAILSMAERSAIIFVSHSIGQVAKICNKGLLLHKGKTMLLTNSVEELIDRYINESSRVQRSMVRSEGLAKIKTLSLLTGADSTNFKFPEAFDQMRVAIVKYRSSIAIRFELTIDDSVKCFHAGIDIVDGQMCIVSQCMSINTHSVFTNTNNQKCVVELTIDRLILGKGSYTINFRLFETQDESVIRSSPICLYENILQLQILSDGASFGAAPVQFEGEWKLSA